MAFCVYYTMFVRVLYFIMVSYGFGVVKAEENDSWNRGSTY